MKAIRLQRFGPGSMVLQEVPTPAPGRGEVVVRVHAASVNPVEWYGVYAPPFVRIISRQLRRPSDPRVGIDLAGTVETVGEDVHDLRPGDAVFGGGDGAWAEYAVASAAKLARKPPGVTFEQAASVPVAGLTALQALRDHAAVQPGQNVLVNGASGGVGTFAVQVAK